MPDISVIAVGKWTVGYHQSSKGTVIQLEWTDREPLNFLIPEEHAVAIANAILENYKNPPPPKDRLS
jgi:hypothetical protein